MKNKLSCALLASLVLAATPLVAQRLGDAVTFDGTNDYVQVASGAANLDFGGTAPFTVEAWVYVTGQGTQRGVVTKYNGGVAASWAVLITSDNKVAFKREVPPYDLFGTQTIYRNSWTHIACTYDGTTMRIYKNAALDTSAARGAQNSATSVPVVIGASLRNSAAERYFGGSIDDVRIWNYARTQSQIQADFGHPLKGNETGLVGYWRLDALENLAVGNAGANDLRDYASGGRHADAIGGVTALWRTRDWDRDGISNTSEAAAGTDGYSADSDGDGVEDGVEVAIGTNPLSAANPATTTDTDRDLLPDAFDTAPTTVDRDGDGFPDGLERVVGTDPDVADSKPSIGDIDGDGRIEYPDAVLLMMVALGQRTLPAGTDDRMCDIDRDGRTTSVDAVILFNYYLGNFALVFPPIT